MEENPSKSRDSIGRGLRISCQPATLDKSFTNSCLEDPGKRPHFSSKGSQDHFKVGSKSQLLLIRPSVLLIALGTPWERVESPGPAVVWLQVCTMARGEEPDPRSCPDGQAPELPWDSWRSRGRQPAGPGNSSFKSSVPCFLLPYEEICKKLPFKRSPVKYPFTMLSLAYWALAQAKEKLQCIPVL